MSETDATLREFDVRIAALPAGTTISALEPDACRPGSVRLTAGGRAVATVDERDIERLRLTPGRPWTDRLAADVRCALMRERARSRATRMLGRRALTRAELVDRLRQGAAAGTQR